VQHKRELKSSLLSLHEKQFTSPEGALAYFKRQEGREHATAASKTHTRGQTTNATHAHDNTTTTTRKQGRRGEKRKITAINPARQGKKDKKRKRNRQTDRQKTDRPTDQQTDRQRNKQQVTNN